MRFTSGNLFLILKMKQKLWKKKLTKNALVLYFAAPFAQRNCSATSLERHLRDIDYLHFGIILG